jgi:hypothetical protein
MESLDLKAEIAFLLLVVVSGFIPFIIQIILVRGLGFFKSPPFRQQGALLAVLLGLFPLGLLFLLGICFFFPLPPAGLFRAGTFLFFVYLLIGYVYFHIFNMSETARRIRILTEIPPTGKIIKIQISRSSPPEEMIATRINRLVALGEIKLEKKSYLINHGFLILPAELLFGFRKLLFPRGR